MRKDKLVMTITIGIMCVILMTIIFIQFRTVEKTDISGVEEMRETELREALVEWKKKYEETNEKYEETVGKINEYKENKESNKEATALLQTELENSNMILGKTTVEGEGVVITLQSGKTTSVENIEQNVDVVAQDLIQLVNELRYAGAEAISINDERVINMTDIVDIGTKYILVNSNRITSPYVVKVIGDKKYLQSALNIKNGYVDLKTSEGKNIQVEEKNNIRILKYSGNMDIKYIQKQEAKNK